MFMGCTTNTPQAQKANPQTTADTIKIETKRDTVLVLDYKPRAKHSYSTTYATNKFGYVYKIGDPKNLPVWNVVTKLSSMYTNTPHQMATQGLNTNLLKI